LFSPSEKLVTGDDDDIDGESDEEDTSTARPPAPKRAKAAKQAKVAKPAMVAKPAKMAKPTKAASTSGKGKTGKGKADKSKELVDDPIKLASAEETVPQSSAKGKGKQKAAPMSSDDEIEAFSDDDTAEWLAKQKGKGKAVVSAARLAKAGTASAASSASTRAAPPDPPPAPSRPSSLASTRHADRPAQTTSGPASAPPSRPAARPMPKTLPPLDEMAAAFAKLMRRDPAQGECIMDEADPDMDDAVGTALVAQDPLMFVEAALVVIKQAEETSRSSRNMEYHKRMLGAVRKFETYLMLARKGAFSHAVPASPTLPAPPDEDASRVSPSASAAPSPAVTSASSSLLPAAEIHQPGQRSDRGAMVPDTIRQLSEMGVSLQLKYRAGTNYISIAW